MKSDVEIIKEMYSSKKSNLSETMILMKAFFDNMEKILKVKSGGYKNLSDVKKDLGEVSDKCYELSKKARGDSSIPMDYINFVTALGTFLNVVKNSIDRLAAEK